MRAAIVALGVAGAAAGPCDIFGAAGTPCVAAHSVTRALYSAYTGPLYQLRRLKDNATTDIAPIVAGGPADGKAQDAFCGAGCVIQRIYDQSPRGNNLDPAPPGGAAKHPDKPVNASRLPTTLNGHPVFAAFFDGSGEGYRIDISNGVATGNEPETIYMVASGQHVNDKCCFDYGNAESNNLDTGKGSMESVYLGLNKGSSHGAGQGPWVQADLENGLWGGGTSSNPNNVPMAFPYVVAMVKGGTNGFALKGGDATKGKLTTLYDGPRPNGYQPMKKQGSIILGVGGDNSDWAVGTFFEGVVTAGYSTDAADAAVAADIAAAGYGM